MRMTMAELHRTSTDSQWHFDSCINYFLKGTKQTLMRSLGIQTSKNGVCRSGRPLRVIMRAWSSNSSERELPNNMVCRLSAVGKKPVKSIVNRLYDSKGSSPS